MHSRWWQPWDDDRVGLGVMWLFEHHPREGAGDRRGVGQERLSRAATADHWRVVQVLLARANVDA